MDKQFCGAVLGEGMTPLLPPDQFLSRQIFDGNRVHSVNGYTCTLPYLTSAGVTAAVVDDDIDRAKLSPESGPAADHPGYAKPKSRGFNGHR